MSDALHSIGKALDKLHLGSSHPPQNNNNNPPPQSPPIPSHNKPKPQEQTQSSNASPRFELGARTPYTPAPTTSPPGRGTFPPRVRSVTYKDRPMRFFRPDGTRHEVLRDLGYTGVLDGTIIWTWGDTLMGTEAHNMICANDSCSIGSVKRPMTACDTAMTRDGNGVKQWIPATPQEEKEGGIARFGYGGTNVVETTPGKGVVYYLKIDRKGGGGVRHGAGVATVKLESRHGGMKVPVATREHDTLWGPKDPNWGDVGAALDQRDGRLYVFGHGPDGDKEIVSRTFLCRVKKEEALVLSAYEYWDNEVKKWRKRRLTIDGEGGTVKLKKEMAIFDWYNMNQSAPFWSAYFNTWMFLYCSCFGYADVAIKTAHDLHGPWKDHGSVAKTDPLPGDSGPGLKALRYCVTGHPEFDESGKTVLATWTRANRIWGVVIEWE